MEARVSQAPPTYPALYQVNARVWLTERSRTLGRPATLDDIPDADLDGIAGMGDTPRVSKKDVQEAGTQSWWGKPVVPRPGQIFEE